jgi:hypothetical protein
MEWERSCAAPSAIPRSSTLCMQRDETSWICGACASFRSAQRHSPSSKKASVSQNELKQTPAVPTLTVSRWACSWLFGSARQSLPKHVLPASWWFSRSDIAFLLLFYYPSACGKMSVLAKEAFWLPCSCARWRSTGTPHACLLLMSSCLLHDRCYGAASSAGKARVACASQACVTHQSPLSERTRGTRGRYAPQPILRRRLPRLA